MKYQIKSLMVLAILTACVAPTMANTNDSSKVDETHYINVTANRQKETIYNSNVDISVVNRKDIETMHINTVEDALRTVPGVQFLDYGPTGLNANLSGIRINGSKDIVILVDGVRMTDFKGTGSSGYAYLNAINNMDNVERVEVLRGSAGALYGSGAKGGVINIITRDINKATTTIDVSSGSAGHEAYKLNTQGKVNKVGYHVYWDKNRSGDFKDGHSKKWNSGMDSTSSGVKLSYDLGTKHKLSAEYNLVNSEFQGKDSIYNNDYYGNYKTKTFTFKDDYYINDKWTNTFVFRKNNEKSLYGQRNTRFPYSMGGDTSYTFVTEQINFLDSKNDLMIGLDYSRGRNNIAQRSSIVNNLVNATMQNYSWFINEDYKILPNVTISGGLRYDRPSTGESGANLDSHVSKSYGMSWDVTKKDRIHWGVSDFYILPSMMQLATRASQTAVLKPAEGRTTSIGYAHSFSKNTLFTLNWFKTKDKIGIGYEGLVNGRYVTRNYTNGIARGWNAQFMSQINSKWNVKVGWAHLYQYASGDNLSKGYYPKDLATFGVYYTNKKVAAGLDGFYYIRKMTPFARNAAWPSNKFGVYNLSMNYSPNKQYTVYARIDNIFNKLWAEHTNVPYGAAGDWYSMPGRTFTIGLKATF